MPAYVHPRLQTLPPLIKEVRLWNKQVFANSTTCHYQTARRRTQVTWLRHPAVINGVRTCRSPSHVL